MLYGLCVDRLEWSSEAKCDVLFHPVQQLVGWLPVQIAPRGHLSG